VLARQSAPVIGPRNSVDNVFSSGSGSGFLDPKRWSMSISYRWIRSHRHFIGMARQNKRTDEGSEVLNNVHLLDVGVTYNVSPRLSFSLGIPFQVAYRKSGTTRAAFLKGTPGVASGVQEAAGLGDISLVGRYWLLKGGSETRQNVALGLGIKLPTGKSSSTSDQRVNGKPNQTVINDQSIQLGDGGTGVIFEVQSFKAIGPITFYGNVTYLANPAETKSRRDGVFTSKVLKQTKEDFLSIGDQYSIRVGGAFALPIVRGLGMSIGMRMEGQPATDLFGGSRGRRRPGYAVSADPGFSYSRGKDSFSVAVPIAISRNRTRNIIDYFNVPRGKGDAAFADYSIQFGYSRRF
jgi:hypothetical protein